MFKKKHNNSLNTSIEEAQTVIGPGVEVKGDFEGEGDVIVEGKLKGTLKTKNNLRIGPEAKVTADIEAENIYIAGEVQGNVIAANEIELSENAKITGDITTKSLIVERNAIFNGQCSMTKDGNDKRKKQEETEEIKKTKNPKQELSNNETQKVEVLEKE